MCFLFLCGTVSNEVIGLVKVHLYVIYIYSILLYCMILSAECLKKINVKIAAFSFQIWSCITIPAYTHSDYPQEDLQ